MIQAGEKIVQFVPFFQPYMKEAIEYDSLEELYKGKKSARGSGGFGSSGEK
jgi:dUTPase